MRSYDIITIRPVYPDISVQIDVTAASLATALPTFPNTNAQKIKRFIFSCGVNNALAFKLGSASDTLADINEGMIWSRHLSLHAIACEGYTHVITFGDGVFSVHVTPLDD